MFTDEVVKLNGFFDFFDRVDGGSVVFAAQLIGNLWEAHVEFAAQQVHSNLPRHNDMLSSLSTTNFFAIDLEMAGGLIDNLFGGEMLRATAPDIAKQAFCCHYVRSDAAHLGISKKLIKRTLELADICLNVLSKVFHGVALKCYTSEACLGLDDRAARLEVGHLDVDCHSPFKAAAQALRQGRDAVRRLVATDDNLLVGLVEGIKGMEELFLSLFAPSNKLHIVDDEHIDIAVPVRKASLFEADRLDKFFDKRFRAQVGDLFAWVARGSHCLLLG